MRLLTILLALLFAAAPAAAEKRIALTFDDVPRAAGAFLTPEERTRLLISALDRAGVVAPTDLVEAEAVRRSWDQRHAVQLGIGHDSARWDLSAALGYHSGWPTTSGGSAPPASAPS